MSTCPIDGAVAPPSSPGFGCDPVPDVVDRYTVGAVSVSNATGAIPVTTIHHVNLAVDDLASATEFYRDVIGLDPIATPDLGFPAQFFSIAPGQELHVNQLDDVHPQRDPLLPDGSTTSPVSSSGPRPRPRSTA